MGEGEGTRRTRRASVGAAGAPALRVGVDKIKTFLVPPPLHPLPPRGGEILSGYVFSMMDSLVRSLLL
jgi:hypothetical protein